MTLEQALKAVKGPDKQAENEARTRWDSLAKPLGSLGLLEDAIVKIAGLTGAADIFLRERSLLIFCADNGVVAEGVSQSGPEVTLAVAKALGQGTSTVDYMAGAAECRVIPADVGVLLDGPMPGVLEERSGEAQATSPWDPRCPGRSASAPSRPALILCGSAKRQAMTFCS